MKSLWVKNWKINNNWKIYFHIDSGASTDQIFALLDTVQSDNKAEIDELMNDFDTEFIAPEEIGLVDNLDNVSVLKPEANVHVVDEGTTHTKELETNKKRKNPQDNIPNTWKRNVSSHFRENCLLEGRVSYQFDKSASAFNILEQIINLDILIELVVNKAISICNKTGGTFSPMPRKWKLGVKHIMAVNQLLSIPLYWDWNHFLGNVGIQKYLYENTKSYKTCNTKSLQY